MATQLESDDLRIIRVPKKLQFGGNFGVIPALIQFLAQWSRHHSDGVVQTYSRGEEEEAVSTLVQSPHGLCAIYFAPNIQSADKKELSYKKSLSYASPKIAAMQKLELTNTMLGRGVFLCCFQGAANEFLNAFYDFPEYGKLRGRAEFKILTKRVISACYPSFPNNFSDRQLSTISTLLYELIKNTDEHAITDESGARYQRNVRGVFAKFITIQSPSGMGSDDPQLGSFLTRYVANQARKKENSKAKNRSYNFLELTIFDTGPGLVSRWRSKKGGDGSLLDLDGEVEVVLDCFEKHASTKDEFGSGSGLQNVVDSLASLNAYLKLRTGRLCLVQDFSSVNKNKFIPKHRHSSKRELPYAAGCSYSILFPLDWES